jgi:predicted nucleic acid binding AN1-type Zn finger protein
MRTQKGRIWAVESGVWEWEQLPSSACPTCNGTGCEKHELPKPSVSGNLAEGRNPNEEHDIPIEFED